MVETTAAAAGASVVIVGVGFAGLAAAKALAGTPAKVTLIDRRNYHLFQPLLYQVATAALSPADIAWPIRSIVARQTNTSVLLGRVVGVDHELSEVILDERRVPYDYLILATGVRHSYFGNEHWEAVAPGLKKISDATHIRERVLLAFERAEMTADPEEYRRLLTFIVVGGGPTGVEMAGAIAELARNALAADFRSAMPADTRVILIEAGPRVLAAFPASLSTKAAAQLRRLGVEVRTDCRVTACDVAGVAIGEERLEARTVIWGAGVIASSAAKWLGAGADRAGRVEVGADLAVPGHPNIFVVGDTACVVQNGAPVPGIAPAAKQMGHYAATVIDARIHGRPDPRPFRYRHYGSLATIGRKAAVADFGRLRLWGYPAWALWAVAHIWFLIGWRNRVVVGLNWVWSYATFERGARLITAPTDDMPVSLPARPAESRSS